MLEQSRTITGSLTEVTGLLKQTLEGSAAEMGDRVRSAVTEAADTIADRSIEMSDSLRQGTAGITRALNESVDGLNKAGAEIVEALGAITGVLAGTVQTHNAQSDLLGRFDIAHRSFAEIARPLGSAADRIGEGARQTERAAAELQAVGMLLGQTNERIAEHNTALTRAWDEYRERFEAVDESLARAFGELDKGLGSFAAKSREYVQGMNKEMATALQQLSAAVGELEGAVDALSRDGKAPR